MKQGKSALPDDHGYFLEHIENLPDIGPAVRRGFQKMPGFNIEILPLAFLRAADRHMGNLGKKDAEGSRFVRRGGLSVQKQPPVSPDTVPDFQAVMEMQICRGVHGYRPVFTKKGENRKTGRKIVGTVAEGKPLE